MHKGIEMPENTGHLGDYFRDDQTDEYIESLHQKIDRLLSMLGLYADLTGIDRETIANAVDYCDQWGISLDEVFDHYNTFYADTPLEHRSEQIINVIGDFVTSKLNEDFGKASGIEDFFELSGNDQHEFWFHYSDSAENCLKELAQKRPEVFNLMSNQTLNLLVNDFGLDKILKETKSKVHTC